jgi:hypothetical protein
MMQEYFNSLFEDESREEEEYEDHLISPTGVAETPSRIFERRVKRDGSYNHRQLSMVVQKDIVLSPSVISSNEKVVADIQSRFAALSTSVEGLPLNEPEQPKRICEVVPDDSHQTISRAEEDEQPETSTSSRNSLESPPIQEIATSPFWKRRLSNHQHVSCRRRISHSPSRLLAREHRELAQQTQSIITDFDYQVLKIKAKQRKMLRQLKQLH